MKIYLLLLGYGLFLFLLGYCIPRHEFWLILIFFGFCFIFYLLICLNFRFRNFSFVKGLLFALLLRMIFLLSIPSLSDDFYRYFFDGQLLNSGLNPYLMTPTEIMNSKGGEANVFLVFLYSKMNSPDYFSVYPPLHQFFFYISSFGGPSLLFNILILRSVLIAFDLLNMYLLYKIIVQLDQSISKVWLYAFNPLIILELTGNLHFEGLVLTGILTSIYFFIRNKPALSSFGWSWAIGIKMTPLMLGLLLVSKWKKNEMLSFVFFSTIIISLALSPLLFSNGFQKLWQSIRLFQSNFEFNASIYYLIKWISGFFISYNPIAYVGPALNIIAFIAIIWYSLKVKIYNFENFCIAIVYIYLIYLLVQNVVHPWYIIPAFGVSLLTKSNIFLVWTGLVFLSYNAYSNEDFKENSILLVVEYSLLFIFIFKEVFFKSLDSKKYQI